MLVCNVLLFVTIMLCRRMQENGSVKYLYKAGLVPAFLINNKQNIMEQEKSMFHMKGISYKKFMVMLLTSFFIMYIVMFLNMDKLSHNHTSTTRVYMPLLMVASMAVVMMTMMGEMYPDK